MTPQEQQLLQGLVDRVNGTVLSEKDPEAEQFIQQSLSRNPDALYILAQTVLVQQYALDQAKKQLDEAKQQAAQAAQPKHSTSFLGNLLGMNDESAARPASPPPPPGPQYAPVQTYAPQQGYVAQPTYPAQPMGGGGLFGGGGMSQGGGFLQSAMRTATGVAAGALAFEGIESLMHGFGQHAGYGSGFEGMGGGQPREEIVNNYYGDSAGEHGHGGDLGDRFAASGDQPSPDVEDRRDDNASNFADTSSGDNSDTSADSSSYDDSSDSSSDFDSGSSDDSSF